MVHGCVYLVGERGVGEREGDLRDSPSSESVRDWCLARRMVSAWLRPCMSLDDRREACRRVEVRMVICFCKL